MSRSAAVFYIDPESGSDTARTNLAPTAYANNGSGLVRVTCNDAVAYASGNAVVTVSGTTGGVYDGMWVINYIDTTHVDLVGSTFSVNPAAKGTMTPAGGSSKADAWKTANKITNTIGVAGDINKFKKSPDPTSIGSATWTGRTRTIYIAAIVSSTNATPIVVRVSTTDYTRLVADGLAVGATVVTYNHTTNTKANGVWEVSALDGVDDITLVNADGTNSVGNGVGGATGSIYVATHNVVKLASAVTRNIALFGNQGMKSNWTASGANSAASISTTDAREGGEALTWSVNASFTTGMAIYWPTGTIDLSAYQGVCFWIKQAAGTVAVAGDMSLRLCTDAVGAVSVHTIAIPALGTTGTWCPVYVDTGGALNSAIQSVALYIDTDRGAQSGWIDCISAVKASSSADSLNVQSLISKNTGDEPWLMVQSINGTRVMLESNSWQHPASSAATHKGYIGTTESVTTYKRQPFMTDRPNNANNDIQAPTNNTSPIYFEGGWDETNMTTQNGQTFFSGGGGGGNGLKTGTGVATFNRFGVFGYVYGVFPGCAAADVIYAAGCTGAGVRPQTWVHTDVPGSITKVISWHNTYGLFCDSCFNVQIGTARCNANSTYGVSFGSNVSSSTIQWNQIDTVEAKGNGNAAANWGALSYNCRIGTLTASWNGAGIVIQANVGTGNAVGTATIVHAGAVNTNINAVALTYGILGPFVIGGGSSTGHAATFTVAGNTGVAFYCKNPLVFRNFTRTGDSALTGTPQQTNYRNDVRVSFENYSGVVGDNRTWADAFVTADANTFAVIQQTSQKHGADNYGLKYNYMVGTNNHNVYYPYDEVIGRFPVAANKLVTVTRWVYRDNTNYTMKLVVKAYQLSGMTQDYIATAAGAAGAWEQLTVTFTPTETGVIEVIERMWGGNSGAPTEFCYGSEVGIAQAA